MIILRTGWFGLPSMVNISFMMSATMRILTKQARIFHQRRDLAKMLHIAHNTTLFQLTFVLRKTAGGELRVLWLVITVVVVA